VLHTWWFPSVYDDIITSRVENDAWAERAREEVQHVVAGLGDVVRGVPVEIEARHAHPADALLDAGRGSTLLVVGRHDPLVPFGSHLGPVARAVLRDAGCPVLLANPTDSHGNRRHHHHGAADSAEPQSTVMS
jgi:nucleotide-binding universal stress UspA family protein